MSITQSIKGSGYLSSGEAYVHGTATFDSAYATGGETLDLSTYILSTDSPTVICNGDDGYDARHDRGTASAGKIMLYTNGSANAVHSQVAANTNAAAVVVVFYAIGQTP